MAGKPGGLARWLTAFENNKFAVAAYAGDEDIPAGIPETMTWELENKTDLAITIILLAEAEDPGADAQFQQQVALERRATSTPPPPAHGGLANRGQRG